MTYRWTSLAIDVLGSAVIGGLLGWLAAIAWSGQRLEFEWYDHMLGGAVLSGIAVGVGAACVYGVMTGRWRQLGK